MKSDLYFKHDVYTLDDPEIMKLLFTYKELGYGVWWAVIERLTSEQSHKIGLDDLSMLVAMKLCSSKQTKVRDVILECVRLGLLSMDDDGTVSNARVDRQCREIEETSRKNAENVRKRWEKVKGNTVVLEPKNEPNTEKIRKEEDEEKKNNDKKNRLANAQAVLELYKASCSGIFNSVLSLSEPRIAHCNVLLADFGKDKIETVFKKASASTFLKGGSQQGWKASFDWLITKGNFIKVLEGNYDDKYITAFPKPSVCDSQSMTAGTNEQGGFDL